MLLLWLCTRHGSIGTTAAMTTSMCRPEGSTYLDLLLSVAEERLESFDP